MLKNFGVVLLPIFTLVALLFFYPATPNFFSTSKQLLLALGVSLYIIVWGISLLVSRSLTTWKSHLTLPLILFIFALAVNLYANQTGWTEALTGRGMLYMLAAALAFIAGTLAQHPKVVRSFVYTFIGGSTLLALHSLLHLTYMYKLTGLPAYMASRAFTPTGNPLTTLTILLVGIAVSFYLASRSHRTESNYLLYGLATLQTIAAVAYISLMLPGGELTLNLLPYQASWSITLDALKSPRTIIFGTGLANFGSLFTAVKPLSLNAGPFWNFIPAAASSEILHLLTTTGLLGLGTFLLIPLVAFTSRERSADLTPVLIIAALTLLSLVFTSATLPVVVILFLSLGLMVHANEHQTQLSQLPRVVILLIALVIAGEIIYTNGKLYLAENHIFRAQKAVIANDGKAVYEHYLAAIKLIPRMTSYRLSYSQVNLSLASTLSEKQDLSDQDREQVTALVQQAIREGKNAASLRPNDASTWQNLGVIYRNLINVAEGSDQFAITAYAQAVQLDPANANLRIEYGTLLYQLATISKEKEAKNAYLTRAAQEYQTAIQLKSDLANAYYNLSKTFEAAGNIQAAYAAMQKTVASLDPNSPDLAQATSELEALKAQLPKESPAPSSSPSPSPAGSSNELVEPSPLPSPIEGGPIDLPAESPTP